MIGLGSVDEDVVADDVTGFDGGDLISLCAEEEEVGVRDGELLVGDSDRFRSISSSSLASSSGTATLIEEVVGDFADKEETFEESDDRPFPMSSRAPVVVESVTLISTEPDRDRDSSRSAECPA
jgi:hypothetical protein